MISRFPVPDLQSMPDDVRQRIDEVAEKTGFVPNVFLALAHRPAEFHAFFDTYEALMGRDGGLTKAEKEMIVVATSAANDCQYCVVAHGALLRVYSKDAPLSDRIAINYRTAGIDERARTIVDVAVKLSARPGEVDGTDHSLLRGVGLDIDDIWDLGAIVALFAQSNRLASWAAIIPNAEFHAMGR